MRAADCTFFIFTSGSDLHLKYKIGKTLLAAPKDASPRSGWTTAGFVLPRGQHPDVHAGDRPRAQPGRARRSGFGGGDGSRADVGYLIELARACYAAGGTRYSFPDTVGFFAPEGVDFYIRSWWRALPDGRSSSTSTTTSASGHTTRCAPCTTARQSDLHRERDREYAATSFGTKSDALGGEGAGVREQRVRPQRRASNPRVPPNSSHGNSQMISSAPCISSVHPDVLRWKTETWPHPPASARGYRVGAGCWHLAAAIGSGLAPMALVQACRLISHQTTGQPENLLDPDGIGVEGG